MPARDSIFDRVRDISSADAAQAAGLRPQSRGGKYWVKCPFHGEDTASMCVYQDSRGWYCFGCHKGGDAVKLYELLYNLKPVDAAKQLARNFGINPSVTYGDTSPSRGGYAGSDAAPVEIKGKAYDLQRAVTRWFDRRYIAVCDAQNRAREDAVRIAGTLGKNAWDSPDFKRAVRLIGFADQVLDDMDQAQKDGICAMIKLYKRRGGCDDTK